MKKFISFINPSIPFGRALNALGHISIGIGHWIPEGHMPSIQVYLAEEHVIRAFRKASHKIRSDHPGKIRCADFINTMTVGPSDNCIKVTAETPDSELVYFAASLCAEEVLLTPEIYELCSQSKMVLDAPHGDHYLFRPDEELPDYQNLQTKKMALVLDRTASLAEVLRATVEASIKIGSQSDLNGLKLLSYCDKDGQPHSCISYHSFPILSARPQSKLQELAAQIEMDPKVKKAIIHSPEGKVLGICLLGEEEAVNIHTRQKFISFWTAELHR
jgi:hypothetical protein